MSMTSYSIFTTPRELSGRVLDSRPKGSRFELHLRYCFVSLSKNINPSLVLVQPRKTCPYITERLLMGRKVSNQKSQLLETSAAYEGITSQTLEEGKDQESTQSSSTPDLGHHMGK